MYRPTQRITVVTRETRLEGLLHRWATRGQAKFKFRTNKIAQAVHAGNATLASKLQRDESDSDFIQLEDEDQTYQSSIKALIRDLDFGLPVQVIDRSFVPNYDFALSAAVVVLGQDGLVANAAKYVGSVPIVGVNPDPQRFDGVLLPFRVPEARNAVRAVLNGKASVRTVTLAEATLQDGQRLLAFNDLFLGVRNHTSARYHLRIAGQDETQSSSGVLVSTGAGSTGWMSSVYNMATAIANSLGASPDEARRPQLSWDDRRLLWAVREPFLSRASQIGLVAGILESGGRIELESMMPEHGVIFSDGVDADALEFNAGTIASVGVAGQQAQLVVR